MKHLIIMSLKLHQKPSLPFLFLLFLLTSPSIQFKLGGRFFIKSHSNGGLVLLVQILGKAKFLNSVLGLFLTNVSYKLVLRKYVFIFKMNPSF